ncbi:unnamed protein product [Symbiodinium natans]|uniref:Uncharacterized protein n=1 Tax=Symbiodinium natans TaxID=878477 RepID=A0A812IXP6_9DINO|nr:unnamed protein product [Symbiodinium natans]
MEAAEEEQRHGESKEGIHMSIALAARSRMSELDLLVAQEGTAAYPIVQGFDWRALNLLSKAMTVPGYLEEMVVGSAVPALPVEDGEVIFCPYGSTEDVPWAHGCLPQKEQELRWLLREPPLEQPERPIEMTSVGCMTTELEDHHEQILSQLTQAASAVDFGCSLKVITLVVNQLGESLISNKSVHPKLLPMSYHLQQGHNFALHLLGLVNLYQEHNEKYDIGHAERVTSENTPMWIQKCIWEVIGNVIKNEAKEHYSLEEYRASTKAARSKAAARPPDGGSDSESSSSGGLLVLSRSYEDLGWMGRSILNELRGKPSEPREITGADYWNLHIVPGEPVGTPEPPFVPPLAVPTPPPIPAFRLPPRPPASGSFRSWFATYSTVCASNAGKPSVSFAKALEVPTTDSTKSRAPV